MPDYGAEPRPVSPWVGHQQGPISLAREAKSSVAMIAEAP